MQLEAMQEAAEAAKEQQLKNADLRHSRDEGMKLGGVGVHGSGDQQMTFY